MKEKINFINLRFDESCYFAEDATFNIQYIESCGKTIFLNEQLYFYYDNPNGVMRKFDANSFFLHIQPFSARLPLIKQEDLGEYCDIWLYQFIHLFDNVFDERNTMTFLQKMRYNQRMIRSEEFRYCVAHASGANESPLVLKILKTHNYYLFWLFQKIVRIKNKRRGT